MSGVILINRFINVFHKILCLWQHSDFKPFIPKLRWRIWRPVNYLWWSFLVFTIFAITYLHRWFTGSSELLEMIYIKSEVFVCFFFLRLILMPGIIRLLRKQNFRKTNISYLLIHTRACAYQGVRNVSFGELLLTY